MEGEKILEVSDLSVCFEEEVLKNISFSVNRGEMMAIMGPNGSGKSVLLRAIQKLVPYTGKVDWAPNLKIDYVPQKLFADITLPLSVGEFLEFKESSHKKVMDALSAVGIKDEHHIRSHLVHRRLGVLSGGQLQRVLIAWSLLDNPDVLLYDEPTSGIDIGGEETIYTLLRQLRNNRRMTIILISHDLNIINEFADKVICVNRSLVCNGIPSQVLTEQTLARLYGGNSPQKSHEHV